MSTSMKLGDDLMKVPKLEVTGSNWVIYKDQFSWAVDAQGLLEHIDGSAWKPIKPSIVMKKTAEGLEEGAETGTGGSGVVEELTEDDKKRLEEWMEKLRVWKLGEAVVKQ